MVRRDANGRTERRVVTTLIRLANRLDGAIERHMDTPHLARRWYALTAVVVAACIWLAYITI